MNKPYSFHLTPWKEVYYGIIYTEAVNTILIITHHSMKCQYINKGDPINESSSPLLKFNSMNQYLITIHSNLRGITPSPPVSANTILKIHRCKQTNVCLSCQITGSNHFLQHSTPKLYINIHMIHRYIYINTLHPTK